ncbi:hypothetical protein BV22DRAFT_592144 [Leucogyrophana mollusca]|uniref:Uncharacterized protein n=1 Tax=Leucogyrophana mollusca TaxID=85980 RepID=A0ACB8BDE0_9AGAM|nr:hypothetical protein BV22DRAFT_592144 [Leucogyrophana mollusca]
MPVLCTTASLQLPAPRLHTSSADAKNSPRSPPSICGMVPRGIAEKTSSIESLIG